MTTLNTLIGAGALFAVLGMLLAWEAHRRIGNAGIVDVAWSAETALLAIFFAIFGAGWSMRRAAIGAVMALANLRLSGYLLRDRVIGRPEDGRYVALRRGWGAKATVRFFWFFHVQAWAALFFALPAILASANPEPRWQSIEIVGLAVWLLAFLGETTADRQLVRFKADPSSRGRTCRVGLWRYSRHPNYFFEWLMWVAYALFALGSDWGATAIACPLVMLYLLFRVTGIPATEEQAVRTRGNDYREYQRTTSAFVPWFPK